MKNLHALDMYRDCSPEVVSYFGNTGDGTCGVFDVPSPTDGRLMRVVASVGADWEHISVSRSKRCPNWPEMEHVKRLFFQDDETVMQLHVPPSDHISKCHTCLHLWRPMEVEIPRPPAWMVA